MKCIFCDGKIVNRKVTFVYDNDDDYFFVENVPAEVCDQCGEKTYSPEIADELIRVAKHKINPIKTIQIPVFDYENQISK